VQVWLWNRRPAHPTLWLLSKYCSCGRALIQEGGSYGPWCDSRGCSRAVDQQFATLYEPGARRYRAGDDSLFYVSTACEKVDGQMTKMRYLVIAAGA
jgi:hypothetical protein